MGAETQPRSSQETVMMLKTNRDSQPRPEPVQNHHPLLNTQTARMRSNSVDSVKKETDRFGAADKKVCLVLDCPHSPPSPLLGLQTLKPRFIRILTSIYPLLSSSSVSLSHHSICLAHLKLALQTRADELVDQDLAGFAQFQDTVMRDLEDYEMGEDRWQEQFDKHRSFGERAADNVARFGGSWPFLFSLGGFIGLWAFLNGILPEGAGQWDAYPYILLNLMLSMLASCQAPVIMMAQNRQAAIDRLQNNYVARAVLRNENQTKHVDAKLDHLISYQWKRLLEIQEIQVQLLQETVLMHSHTTGPKEERSRFWAAETWKDEFSRILLGDAFDLDDIEDQLFFAHWHEEGDNFTGTIDDVVLRRADKRAIVLEFDIKFPTNTSLDDLLQGEVNITLRNDFNISYMNLLGRIDWVSFSKIGEAQKVTLVNGDFPPRYKPAFVRHRPDRVTDLWKTHLDAIRISYSPPPLYAVIKVPKDMHISRATASSFSSHTLKHIGIYWKTVQQIDGEALLKEVVAGFGGWNQVHHPVEHERLGAFPVYGIDFSTQDLESDEIGLVGSSDSLGVVGPCYLVLASTVRLAWQGVLEKLAVVSQEKHHELARKLTAILSDSDLYKEKLPDAMPVGDLSE
ncbi:hypothetical protein HDU91_004800 [Kappamyces sp. JEL0680]|nr:hypothetical protein HDU91_004800 [Kappamyces sp. JEL0680]